MGQALLRCLSQEGRRAGSPLHAVLEREGVAVDAGPTTAAPLGAGAWRGRRLLQGRALEQASPALRRELATALLAKPPFVLRWLSEYDQVGCCRWNSSCWCPAADSCMHACCRRAPASSPAAPLLHPPAPQAFLLRCATDASFDAAAALAARADLSGSERADVLVLRGLLAYGVLELCLGMRHQVDHGLHAAGAAHTRLSVPFRAAHKPSERSVFAQPDTALTLTALAYYHTGLSRGQLVEALGCLLRLGPSAQEAEYGGWLQLARADRADGERSNRRGSSRSLAPAVVFNR